MPHTYDLPPADFQPLAEPDLKLARFGLPVRPDASREPELFQLWGKLLGAPLTIVQPAFPMATMAGAFSVGAPAPTGGTGRPIFSYLAHLQDSPNWSGAVITPIRPNRIVLAAGTWRVPEPRVPALAPVGVDLQNATFASSTWIGIGGQRPYNSLPQIGTAQYVRTAGGVATPDLHAWWQWWVADQTQTHHPVRITNMPVAVGDEMIAIVMIEPPGDAHFILKNHTQGVLVAFKEVAPAGIHPLGATAEWIHECPTRPGQRTPQPLPACDDVIFTHCYARSADADGNELPQRLENARLVRLYERYADPSRTRFTSVPAKLGPTSVRIGHR